MNFLNNTYLLSGEAISGVRIKGPMVYESKTIC
jgi:hypothetical protein